MVYLDLLWYYDMIVKWDIFWWCFRRFVVFYCMFISVFGTTLNWGSWVIDRWKVPPQSLPTCRGINRGHVLIAAGNWRRLRPLVAIVCLISDVELEFVCLKIFPRHRFTYFDSNMFFLFFWDVDGYHSLVGTFSLGVFVWCSKVGMVAKKKKSKTHEVLVWKAGWDAMMENPSCFLRSLPVRFIVLNGSSLIWQLV